MNEIHQNMNQTYQNQVTRLSGYTSTNHHLYNSFLFDTLKIPISLNNRVGQIDQNNLFYLKMLSVDSIISKKKIDGYQEIDAIKDLRLYQSQDIMPIQQINSIAKISFINCNILIPWIFFIRMPL